jgi:chromate reductase, NAD(P)H dehydrogenase (quinone)
MRILAISGSLRSGSSNTALLEAAALLAGGDMHIELYPHIGRLPHFNPDLDGELQDSVPQIIRQFRDDVVRADGLLISCPEYARGIPGSFKNALDWLVGCPLFFGKPTALLNASPRASAAQSALRLVLETMAAQLMDEASIEAPLLARHMDAQAIAEDPQIGPLLRGALEAFRRAIIERRARSA